MANSPKAQPHTISSAKFTNLWKTKFLKIPKFFLALVLITGWVFAGWPAILSRAQEATSRPPVAASTLETATTTAETATSTPAISTSTMEIATSSASSSSELVVPASPEPPTSEELPQEAPQVEIIQSPEPPPLPALPSVPPLKKRKLERQVTLNKNARHECRAKAFTIDISGRDSSLVELSLLGERNNFENIEIGSLPDGIDITFLNNANYSYSPSKRDNAAVFQIVNQPGSQKGNFSVPIIYTSGDSTTICQINIINF